MVENGYLIPEFKGFSPLKTVSAPAISPAPPPFLVCRLPRISLNLLHENLIY